MASRTCSSRATSQGQEHGFAPGRPDLAFEVPAAFRLHVGHGDAGALAANSRAVASPMPEAPAAHPGRLAAQASVHFGPPSRSRAHFR